MGESTTQNPRGLDFSTRLAVERTRVAYERTMLAWLSKSDPPKVSVQRPHRGAKRLFQVVLLLGSRGTWNSVV
jgi:hypothetical protein